MNMNINECYGNLDLPSEIVDSFEQESYEENSYNNGSPRSPRLNQMHQNNMSCDMNSGIGLDSSLEDTFLANLPPQIRKSQKQIQEKEKEKSDLLVLSRDKI